MPFLAINGWTVPVADGEARVSFDKLGAAQRSYNGVLRGTRRAKVRQWEVTTTIKTNANAIAFEASASGDGQVWSFDNDLFSSKGLAPDAGYNVTLSATGGKYGGYVQVSSNTNLTYSVDLGQVSWTMLVWKEEGGVYYHYGINSDGTQYKNGAVHSAVPTDNVTEWFTGSTSSMSLRGKDIAGTNANAKYDDFVVMPFTMPLAQIAAVYNLGLAHPLAPQVLVSGDLLGGPGTGPVYAIGNVDSAEFVQVFGDDGFAANYRRVNAQFSEVKQQGRS